MDSSTKTIKYYARPFKSIFFLLLSVAFTALCVSVAYLTIRDQEYNIIILLTMPLGVIFFSLGIVWFGWLVLTYITRKPLLMIDQNGLTDNTDILEYGRKISWEEVIDARIIRQNVRTGRSNTTKEYIGLKLKNPDKFAQGFSKWKKHVMRINAVIMKGEYAYITTDVLNAKINDVLTTIQEMSSGKTQLVGQTTRVDVRASVQDIPSMLLTGQGGDVKHSVSNDNMPPSDIKK